MPSKEILDLIRLPSNVYHRDTVLLLSLLDDFEAINRNLKNETQQTKQQGNAAPINGKP